MDKPDFIEGGCLCGATRYRATGTPPVTIKSAGLKWRMIFLATSIRAPKENEIRRGICYPLLIFRWFFADNRFTRNDWRFARVFLMRPRVIVVLRQLLPANPKTVPVNYPASH